MCASVRVKDEEQKNGREGRSAQEVPSSDSFDAEARRENIEEKARVDVEDGGWVGLGKRGLACMPAPACFLVFLCSR